MYWDEKFGSPGNGFFVAISLIKYRLLDLPNSASVYAQVSDVETAHKSSSPCRQDPPFDVYSAF